MQQIIELPEFGGSRVLFNDPASPKVGPGIAQCAEHAFHQDRFVGARTELEFHWVDLDGVWTGEIAPAIDEPSSHYALPTCDEREPACRNSLRLARQSYVDETFGSAARPRSHCRVPWGYLH